MELDGYKKFTMRLGATSLECDLFRPLARKSTVTVFEFTDGQEISGVIEHGLPCLKKEMARADYLADITGGMTPDVAVEWLIGLYSEKHGEKKIASMKSIHNERGIRLAKYERDELNSVKNFGALFETEYEALKEEQKNRDFTLDDCDCIELDIQQRLRNNQFLSIPAHEVTRLFRRAHPDSWRHLFTMEPDKAAMELLNAQRDKRNSYRREQVPCIITDLREAIIYHPYRYAMQIIIDDLKSKSLLEDEASEKFNRWFYHYPQRFFDGIIPFFHPLGKSLLHSPTFVAIIEKLYGDNPDDTVARDFILASQAAVKIYAVISELDRDDNHRKQSNKHFKFTDPKLLEDTVAAPIPNEEDEEEEDEEDKKAR